MSLKVCGLVKWSKVVNFFFIYLCCISVWYWFMLLPQIKNDNIIMKYILVFIICVIIYLCTAPISDKKKVFFFYTSWFTINSRNGKPVTTPCIARFIISLSYMYNVSITCKKNVWRYSGTCLIRHTKGPRKCVGLYRMFEYSCFALVNGNTLGPSFSVGCHRMSENTDVGLHKFQCTKAVIRAVNRRRDNTLAKRQMTGGQTMI